MLFSIYTSSDFSKYYFHLFVSFLSASFYSHPFDKYLLMSTLPVKFPYSWPPTTLSYKALHLPPELPLLLNPQVTILSLIIHITTPSSITYILTLLHVA